MKKHVLRAAWRFAAPAAMAFSMQVNGPLAIQRDPALRERVPLVRDLSKLALPGSSDLQLIIELSSPPVVKYLQAAPMPSLSTRR